MHEDGEAFLERVLYFVLAPEDEAFLALLPERTLDRRFARRDELAGLPLVNEGLRGLLRRAVEEPVPPVGS